MDITYKNQKAAKRFIEAVEQVIKTSHEMRLWGLPTIANDNKKQWFEEKEEIETKLQSFISEYETKPNVRQGQCFKYTSKVYFESDGNVNYYIVKQIIEEDKIIAFTVVTKYGTKDLFMSFTKFNTLLLSPNMEEVTNDELQKILNSQNNYNSIFTNH